LLNNAPFPVKALDDARQPGKPGSNNDSGRNT
jgi:hypothetical protein